MKKFISVVIPAHNEERYLRKCLESLISQDYGPENYEIVLIDNDSKDETKNIAKEFEGISYHYKKDGPVGAVRNYGASKSSGPYIAFIDADCVAPNDWLSTGALLLEENENQAFGGKYIAPDNALWIEKYWLLGSKEKHYESTDFLGGCIFLKREDFIKVNGFNEKITSGEDTKLAIDLKNKGITPAIDQSINVVHLGNAKSPISFIKRQAWHSENYIKNLKSSIVDPTFLVTLIFLISPTTSIIILFIATPSPILLLPATLFALCPMILSAKRIKRSNVKKLSASTLSKIYAIDTLYLIGRSAGLLRGLIKTQKSNPARERKAT